MSLPGLQMPGSQGPSHSLNQGEKCVLSSWASWAGMQLARSPSLSSCPQRHHHLPPHSMAMRAVCLFLLFMPGKQVGVGWG